MSHVLERAANTRDIEEFLTLVFPPEWHGISARILETGAEFADGDGSCRWAPRWSRIPLTVRTGKTDFETAVKSVIFRVHDCLHQLWGLPHPGEEFTNNDFYYYKRSQMCGEVAVLTLTEFIFCLYLYEQYPETQELLWERNALQMRVGPLMRCSTEQLAMRLDGLLHKKIRPSWVRNHPPSMAFCDDYVPMLEEDRRQIDQNWQAMKQAGWLPRLAPKARFGRHLDGLELTVWMIRDFEHLLDSHHEPDRALMDYNRERRRRLVLPVGWAS